MILVPLGLKACWKAGWEFPKKILTEMEQEPDMNGKQIPNHRSPSTGGILLLCAGWQRQAPLWGVSMDHTNDEHTS